MLLYLVRRAGGDSRQEGEVRMGSEVRLSSIGQIGVHVSDLKAAIDFYREKLGLTFLGEAPPSLAFFDCGGVRLMLSAIAEGASDGNSVLYFDVPDIRDAYETLRERSVRFTGKPHVIHSSEGYELWMAFFEDSHGNAMALQEERGELRL